MSKSIRVLTVKYEDLVSDPNKTLQEIAEFAGLGDLPKLHDQWYDNTTLQTDFSYGGKVKAINKSSIGKWRTDVTGRSKSLLDDSKARQLLRYYQYIE